MRQSSLRRSDSTDAYLARPSVVPPELVDGALPLVVLVGL